MTERKRLRNFGCASGWPISQLSSFQKGIKMIKIVCDYEQLPSDRNLEILLPNGRLAHLHRCGGWRYIT